MTSFWDPFGIDRFFRSRMNDFFGPFSEELDFNVTPRQAIEPGNRISSGNSSGAGGQLINTSNTTPSWSLMPQWNRVRMDLVERPDSYVALVEIPGIPKENVNVYIEGNVLTIEGEKKMENRQESDQVHVTERSYGKFRRSLRMPDNCNLEDCKTFFDNGVLNLTFGKKEQTNRKNITLE